MKADVLIVTVTEVEARALLKVFRENRQLTYQQTRINDLIYHNFGKVNGSNVFMVQSEMGAIGLGSALQTIQKGITDLSPSSVIMVGIAFGLKPDKQSIGDILVSRQLMLYDPQRIGTAQGEVNNVPRGDRPHASPRLLNWLKSAQLQWTSQAILWTGLILTGEKLVDNLDFCHQLCKLEHEAIGGEMEGAGLYVSCQDKNVDWILVKGICDWADGQKSQNETEAQRLAAINAASFVLFALQRVPLKFKKWISVSTLSHIWAYLLLIILLPVITSIIIQSYKQNTLSRLRKTQFKIQRIERQINQIADNYTAMPNGKRVYFDPSNKKYMMIDIWMDNKLNFRDFYIDKRHIARDTFHYDGDIITGKEREYINNSMRVFLRDEFMQDGLLRGKWEENPPKYIFDDMRSPLPPPTLTFYR